MNNELSEWSRPRIWGVNALMHAIGDSLAARFALVLVRGELAGFTRAASGHCYFTVKDEQGGAALRCVMFRRAAAMQAAWPGEGQVVEIKGRLGVYEPRGELQLVAESLQTAGAGSLYERFLRLKVRLEAEGLFAAERKRAVVEFPRAIGVVTSQAGAALHDVLTTLARRAPHVRVVIYPCSVQGSEAPPQIVAALHSAALRAEVDTLIVCRGGGSLEDLWAFNDEAVVRAIAASPIPVVCGVGHETDSTLADFAADVRAPTPTAAAELAALAQAQALDHLARLQRVMAQRVGRTLEAQAQRMDRATLRLARPAQAVARHRHTLAALQQRMSQGPRLALARGREGLQPWAGRLGRALRASSGAQARELASLAQRLQALNPSRVLERGYAWLARADGSPLLSAQQAAVGDVVVATLSDGSLEAQVSAVLPAPDA